MKFLQRKTGKLTVLDAEMCIRDRGEVTSTAMSRGMITRKGRQQMVYTSVRPMDA